jgi:hypothetical protein
VSATLELVSGGSAVLVAREGEHATLETGFASPPGSTVEVLVLGAPVRLKVRRCQRREHAEGARFWLEGRWLNLSKDQREHLAG